MKSSERLNLKNLVDQSDYVNNTENIRKLKHSVLIRDDIRVLDRLKTSKAHLKTNDFVKFLELCQSECRFLYDNYTDIFHKMIKDELDMRIMSQLLIVLKLIEDGNVDQHDGSVMVGKILKELYVDSALKRSENLDKEYESQRVVPIEGKPISWKDYKKTI
jgi:hypothetical protein